MSGGRPYYGYPTWHVLSNIILGSIALAASVIGFFAVSPLMLALMPAAAYFFWNAYLWARGGFLEEKLRIREEFMRIVKPADGELVLDVGTGGGLLAIGYAKAMKSGRAVGIDLWIPAMGRTSMETALRNAELEGVSDRVEFRRGDACSIPYPDNHFDKVVASFAIHTIPQKKRDRAFEEMIRVLKPGGILAILEPKSDRWIKWRIDENLRRKLEGMGLRNVRFHPVTLTYPKKRVVYLITGVKEG
ncbi:MAG TPA: class I SAM-dependent methyltransferase [Nitrososphaeria archaeon]|nr:class I SAM-dependent methyltransferase [Nitrososphaeria archaeon]